MASHSTRADSLVHHFLERSAERAPALPFLIHDGNVTTYAQAEARANQLARTLQREGLATGDRVALLAENSAFYAAAYYGVLKAGGIAVPLNRQAHRSALEDALRGCGARMLLAGAGCGGDAAGAAASAPSLELLGLETGDEEPEPAGAPRLLDLSAACADESSEPLNLRASERDVANIVYTSGSTRAPLGVTLSHRNLVSNSESIVSYLGLGPHDRVLQVLPFFYVYGQSLLLTHSLVGGSLVIENRFMFFDDALDTLEAQGCTGLSGVPSTFAMLLNRSSFARRELATLRYVTVAGGAISPALTRRLIDALPDRKIFIMYGATEASARLAYLPPDSLEQKLGSIGVAIPGVELRVLREDGSETSAGEQGEIVARGPNLMQGYWGDPEASAQVLTPEGYRTGDLAWRDADGFLFVAGRSRDIIKAGAHRVSAKEIEDAVSENPDVHEVAVVGVPDETLGEKICAFVVLREGSDADAEQLKLGLRGVLPRYKIPSEFILMSDLPKSAAGKILKTELGGCAEPSSGATE